MNVILKSISKEEEMLNLLERDLSLKDLPYQNEIICKRAIEINPQNIPFIKEELLTEELKQFIVKENCFSIKYIECPSEEVQLISVSGNGMCIYDIENPTKKVQEVAVKKDYRALGKVEEETFEILDIAIKQSAFALVYAKTSNREIEEFALNKDWRAYAFVKQDYNLKDRRIFSLKDKEPCGNIFAELVNNTWLFTCSEDSLYEKFKRLTKKEFIYKINTLDGGLSDNLHRREYLNLLENF